MIKYIRLSFHIFLYVNKNCRHSCRQHSVFTSLSSSNVAHLKALNGTKNTKLQDAGPVHGIK